MWGLLLVIFGVWNGVLAADDKCSDEPIGQCFPDRGDVDDIPGNAEELRQLCSYLRTSVRCVEGVKEECGLDNYDQQRMDLLGDFVRATCQEGSRLNTQISDNMPCLKEVIDNDSQLCSSLTRNSMRALKDHLESKKASRDEEEIETLYDCLFSSLQANCFLAQVSNKCGNEAKEASLELMDRTGILKDQCPASMRVEIEEMLEILAMGIQEDIYVKDLFD
ncbi:uncharacterized protein CDAR_427281 [Caerostris darwini]|uniref:Secreted protein n=1 Tax=Caerostris darwini TaxID=1538125 RepID=A0AAV4PJY3_9ARAC|nr:uncharacterized protein CDAR_427281 [Caerostris darwini]